MNACTQVIGIAGPSGREPFAGNSNPEMNLGADVKTGTLV